MSRPRSLAPRVSLSLKLRKAVGIQLPEHVDGVAQILGCMCDVRLRVVRSGIIVKYSLFLLLLLLFLLSSVLVVVAAAGVVVVAVVVVVVVVIVRPLL